MGTAVKKTISLPPALAKEAEEMARAEGKTLSAVIQDVLRAARATFRPLVPQGQGKGSAY